MMSSEKCQGRNNGSFQTRYIFGLTQLSILGVSAWLCLQCVKCDMFTILGLGWYNRFTEYEYPNARSCPKEDTVSVSCYPATRNANIGIDRHEKKHLLPLDLTDGLYEPRLCRKRLFTCI